jgi:hypothetical protein
MQAFVVVVFVPFRIFLFFSSFLFLGRFALRCTVSDVGAVFVDR